jgi:hypothetical protein
MNAAVGRMERGGARLDVAVSLRSVMPTYCLQGEYGYVGLLEHPAPNLEAGDIVVLGDGRQALVTARVESWRGSRFAAVLDVVLLTESDSPEANAS